MKKNLHAFILLVSAICIPFVFSCGKKSDPKPPPVVDSLKIGLVAYYPFNNSAADESGKGYDGVFHDITVVANRSGVANSAAHFNGTSSYIDVKDNTDLRLSNTNFTVNYWVNLEAYNALSGNAVIEKNNGAGGKGWNCGISGLEYSTPGEAFYNESGANDPIAYGDTVIPLNSWHMVTITYDVEEKEINFYVDGVLDTTSDNLPTPNPETNVDMFIGKNSFSANNTPGYFIQGTLDDIRIYKRKLKDSEIKQLYSLPN